MCDQATGDVDLKLILQHAADVAQGMAYIHSRALIHGGDGQAVLSDAAVIVWQAKRTDALTLVLTLCRPQARQCVADGVCCSHHQQWPY